MRQHRPAEAELAAGLRLRPAEAGDVRRLYDWRNDPVARAMSRSGAPIAFEDHVRWFEAALADAHMLLLVAEVEGEPVGVVRFSHGEAWETHVAIAPHKRGQGLASAVLCRGIEALQRSRAAKSLIAYIRPDNRPSLAAFERAGYRRDGETEGMLVLRLDIAS